VIRALLIDDTPGGLEAVRKVLAETGEDFRLDLAERAGLQAMLEQRHDVYLLAFSIEHNRGLDLLREALSQGVIAPIIVLLDTVDDDLDLRALRAGAADCLKRAELNPQMLRHAVRFARARAEASTVATTTASQASAERDRLIEQLTILSQIDAELSQILNIENVLALALDAVVRLSGANAGFIGLMDNGQVRLAQAIGYYTSITPGGSLPDTPLIDRLVDDMEARLILDVTQEPDYKMMNPHTRAQMLLPLVSYERLIGILNVETDKPERFAPEVFEFLRLITARAAVAVENAQLYKISQDQLAELQDLYAAVSQLEQLKTDMIRIAAHDLRSPVGIILGYTDMLKAELGEAITPDQIKYLEAIERAALRMEKITADILSLERIENLQVDRPDRLDLTAQVGELYEEFLAHAGLKLQDFRIEMSDEQLQVRADGGQLREAIANLMSNAIKYTPENGHISIKLIANSGEVVFTVTDDGYGIPEREQVKLFKPFSRAYSKETADIDGTGLGLYLIKNIIERYGGSIIFESSYGQGSTFGFRLPLIESGNK
jgi:signal transduction histidine kinase/DNA-binding NarL/FixJ family response regulator